VTAPAPANAWVRFWFALADPIALHVLRVLAGLLFLYWALPLALYVTPLLGMGGWVDAQTYRDLSTFPGAPAINWSLFFLCGPDPSPAVLGTVAFVSLAVLVLFTLGVWPRLTAVLTWMVVCTFLANPALHDDADWLLPILAFYPVIGFVLMGQRLPDRPLAWRILGPVWPYGKSGRADPYWRNESTAANLALRLLQVHFAIAWVTNGFHKLQAGDWWAGIALWFPLHPPLETSLADVYSVRSGAESYFFLLSLAGYAVLAWQLGFPAFAWRRGWWRAVLLGGALVCWLWSAFVLWIPVFGPLVLVFCLAYVTPAEWRRVLALVARRGPRSAEPARREVRPVAAADSAAIMTRR
jgi:hypothetical protein